MEEEIALVSFTAWNKSKSHKQNILAKRNLCMGVGIYGDEENFYGTQLFSSHADDC